MNSILFCQNETQKWYFGGMAGLDFGTNPPTVLSNSSMSVTEGCASIANNSGNLLFYTDGITIWNASHAVMSNGTGLLGNNGATQPCIILKKPSSTNLYYVFTVQGYGGNAGLNYSLVDMNLAAGQGSVVIKNSPLFSASVCGKITATKHCNGSDYWVVVREFGYPNSTNASFRSYLLSNTGVNSTAVVSTFSTNPYNTAYELGCMKISPNGKKLATTNYWTNNVNFATYELFDYDNTTGVVSNSVAITTYSTGGYNYGYGIEFSPDCSKLYGVTWLDWTSNQSQSSIRYTAIFQWNLCAGSNSAIATSQTLVGIVTNTSSYIGSLQLASNGKIYVARYYNPNTYNFLSVINNPNNLGAACNFSFAGQTLGQRVSIGGLPNFPGSYFLQLPTLQPFTYTVNLSLGCQTASFTSGIPASMSLSTCATVFSVTNVIWDFGDPTSGTANTSNLLNPSHQFSNVGTYTTQLIINYGCGYGTDTLRQVVNITSPCINVTTNSITCATLGSASVSISSGGPYTYTWLPINQTGSVVSGLSPGTYTLLVYDGSNSNTYTTSTTLLSPSPLTGNLNNSSSITCYGAATGTAAYTNIAGGSTLQVYSWSTATSLGVTTFTSNQSSFNMLSAGVWSSTVTDALTGCTIHSVITIQQPPALSLTIVASTPSVCLGSSFVLTGNASGGSPGYQYNWLAGPSTHSRTVLPSAAGNYTYTLNVSDMYTCTTNNTISIQVVSHPILTAGNATICQFQTATLNVSGASNYTWFTNSGNSIAFGSTFTVNAPGSQYYSVLGEALGCSSIDSAFVIVKPSPVPMFSSNSPVCEGSQLILACNSGTNYIWNGPNGFVSTANNNSLNAITLNAGGIYNVTVTSLNSCTASTSGTVLIKPLPTLSISPNTQSLCAGLQTLNLNAAGSATLFNWSPNQHISNINGASVFVYPSANQTYSAIGSLNGCTAVATTSVFVVSPPNLGLSLSSNSFCAQALNGSPNSITLTAGGANHYTISTPAHFYNSNSGGPSTAISLLPPYLNAGPATATLYGSNGVCTLSVTAVYSVVGNPTISVNNPTPVICAGQSFTYTNAGANSFVWSSSTPGSTIYYTGNVAVANPSINSVFSVYGGSLGCNSALQTSTITVKALPNVSISPNPTFVCSGKSIILNATGNGTAFVWSSSSLPNFNTNPTVNVSPVKQETYTLIASLNNCTNTANATVSVMQLPMPGIVTNKNTLCLNQDLILSGNGAKYYYWTIPNKIVYKGQTVKIPMFNLGFAGNYTLTAIDSNACEATAITNIMLLDIPTGYLKSNQSAFCVPFCSSFQFVLNPFTSSGIKEFSWTINDQLVSSAGTFSSCFTKAGEYKIKGDLQSTQGCANSVLLNVTAYPKPKAEFTFLPDKPIENMDEVAFKASQDGIRNFEWVFGTGPSAGNGTGSSAPYFIEGGSGHSANYLFENAGVYPVVLVVSNEYNCKDTLIKPITVYPDLVVFVPNVFTPNADRKNDTFVPVVRAAQSIHLEIYDRWGEKLFETNGLDVGWDGTYKGQDCKQDIYVWKLEIVGQRGEAHGVTNEKTYTGQVLLMR